MPNADLKKPLITRRQLQQRAKVIGRMINQRHGSEPITIIGLLKGSYVFVADVVRYIKNPQTHVEFMVISSYKNGSSIGEITINLDLKNDVKNQVVVILEDIVDTGRTLAKVKAMLLERGARQVEIAAMCTKPSRREVHIALDYPAFTIPDEIVVGYGLDYNEMYRQLPYVTSLTAQALAKYHKA